MGEIIKLVPDKEDMAQEIVQEMVSQDTHAYLVAIRQDDNWIIQYSGIDDKWQLIGMLEELKILALEGLQCENDRR